MPQNKLISKAITNNLKELDDFNWNFKLLYLQCIITCRTFCLGTVLKRGLDTLIVGVRKAVVDVPIVVDETGETTAKRHQSLNTAENVSLSIYRIMF